MAKRVVAKHASEKKQTADLLDTATLMALVLASFASGGLALALGGVTVAIPAVRQ